MAYLILTTTSLKGFYSHSFDANINNSVIFIAFSNKTCDTYILKGMCMLILLHESIARQFVAMAMSAVVIVLDRVA